MSGQPRSPGWRRDQTRRSGGPGDVELSLSLSRVTPFQLWAVLVNTPICGNIMVLPRQMALHALTGAGLAIFLGWLVALASATLVVAASERNGHTPHIHYLPRLLGQRAGRAVLGLLGVVHLALAAVVDRLFADLVNEVVLPSTPLDVVLVSMIALAVYQGRQTMAGFLRTQEFLAIPLLALAFGVVLPALGSGRMNRLLPPWGESAAGLFQALPFGMHAYCGYDTLFLLFGLTSGATALRGRVRLAAALGLAIPMVVYVLVTEVALSVFGAFELRSLKWPLLELVRYYEIRGIILERVDAFLVALWVLVVFTTVASFHFVAIHELASALRLRVAGPLSLPAGALAFVFATLPPTVLVERVTHWLSLGAFGLFTLVAAVACLLAGRRGRGGRRPLEA